MSRETFSDTVIERLRSGRVLALTGAGVSAESGLPPLSVKLDGT